MLVAAASKRMSPSSAPAAVVLIRSSAYSSLPAPGNRVGPSDVANMPTIRSSAAAGTPAIKTAQGSHHYRLVGLNIESHSGGSNGGIVVIGGGETALNQFPTDITIDRCIVRGATANNTIRAVEIDAIRGAVIDSYIYDVKHDGTDSQAVWCYTTPGPVKVVNNYLEDTGENFLVGGEDTPYTAIPSDIEFRHNYCYKPSTWKTSYVCKNLFELKNSKRVLAENNIFDTNFYDAQSGYAILFTVRNQSGGNTFAAVNDIVFRYNKLINSDNGINTSGFDDLQTSADTTRITIKQNLISLSSVTVGTVTRSPILMLWGPDYVSIIHNTFLSIASDDTRWMAVHDENGAGAEKCNACVIKDNIWYSAGGQEISGGGTSAGNSTFSTYYESNLTFSYNVVIGGSSSFYSNWTDNNFFPANTAAVGFEDFAGGDYRLAAGSAYKAGGANDASDSTDMGCDIATLNTRVANVVTGQRGSEDVTSTSTGYDEAAELPRTYIDTTYANQTGTTHVCTTAAEFTTALANCAIGDIIELTAGNTFTGSFTLRNI